MNIEIDFNDYDTRYFELNQSLIVQKSYTQYGKFNVTAKLLNLNGYTLKTQCSGKKKSQFY